MTASEPENCCCDTQFMRRVMDDIRYNPGAEIIRYGRGRKDLLSLAQGESDEPTPAFICQAATDALNAGYTHYAPVLGRNELRQAISDYYRDICNLSIAPERSIVTSSGMAAIHLALTSVLDAGDEAVVVMPLWKNLFGAVKLQQAVMHGVDLRETENGWMLDLNELFAAVTPKTRAIVINSPNNPTGWMMSRDDMKAVLDFARPRGIWIISDEVYSRIVYSDANRADSFLDVAHPDDRVFVVHSFSKNWSMTGWRLGWLTGPAAAEERIYDLILYDNMGAPNFTQFGAMAALKHGEEFLEAQKKRFTRNLETVHDRLTQTGRIDFHRPDSAFYAFFRVEGEPDCMAFARRLVDDVGLSLSPGCSFGRNVGGYMRLCFAVSEAKLDEGLTRLERALR